jgi:predicted transcriptional regulator
MTKQRLKDDKSRVRFTLLVEILKAAKTEKVKARILCDYNFNNSLKLELAIQFLLEKKLLSKKIDANGQEQISTTEKGNEFVKTFLDLERYSNKIPVFVHHNVIYKLD